MKNNMFRLSRDYMNNEIGLWQYKRQGRPSEQSTKHWQMKCNFVFRIVGTTSTTDNKSKGWKVCLYYDNHKIPLFISHEEVTNTSALRKTFMKSLPGIIARLKSEDFLDFLEEDSKQKLPNILFCDRCGKIVHQGNEFWVFPDRVLDSRGKQDHNADVMFTNSEFFKSRALPALPNFHYSTCTTKDFQVLGSRTRQYFGPRTIHALHIYSTALKAVLRDSILKEESMNPITNVSGPPNIGKTFACAITLCMMNTPQFMLSQCTASSLLDTCDAFNNMLIVWDDPRDAAPSKLCTIVHEAFHGNGSSTISKGYRNYNSSILIGTQQPLLGLPQTSINLPTISRLSHIDMNCCTEFTPETSAAKKLAEVMQKLPGAFPKLISQKYNKITTDRLYKRLLQKSSQDIIDRSLRIAAIDWNLCLCINEFGFHYTEQEIDYYFEHIYVNFLQKFSTKTTHIQKFIKCVKKNEKLFDRNVLKNRANILLKTGEVCECIAIYMKAIVEQLRCVYSDLPFHADKVMMEIKQDNSLGELNHNVSFKNSDKSSSVKRALVIKKCIWDSV